MSASVAAEPTMKALRPSMSSMISKVRSTTSALLRRPGKVLRSNQPSSGFDTPNSAGQMARLH